VVIVVMVATWRWCRGKGSWSSQDAAEVPWQNPCKKEPSFSHLCCNWTEDLSLQSKFFNGSFLFLSLFDVGIRLAGVTKRCGVGCRWLLRRQHTQICQTWTKTSGVLQSQTVPFLFSCFCFLTSDYGMFRIEFILFLLVRNWFLAQHLEQGLFCKLDSAVLWREIIRGLWS
jgi:hypothetical protein